jgi:enamine deaminase RidA (YjgF/YER057c/UK114 family)
MTSIDEKLASLGLQLPTLTFPLGAYVPYVQSGNLLFVSGQGAKDPAGNWLRGRVGEDATKEEGYERARLATLSILAVAKSALTTLDRVSRVVKVVGFVNSTSNFHEHPAVINGCSDLLLEVFGERGRHARSAVGVTSLPMNWSVEIEAILEIA